MSKMTGSTQHKILEWLINKRETTDKYFTIEEIRRGIQVNYKVVWNDIFMLERYHFLESTTIMCKGYRTYRVWRYKKVLKNVGDDKYGIDSTNVHKEKVLQGV
jgi:hypothetical protein